MKLLSTTISIPEISSFKPKPLGVRSDHVLPERELGLVHSFCLFPYVTLLSSPSRHLAVLCPTSRGAAARQGFMGERRHRATMQQHGTWSEGSRGDAA